MSAELPCQRQRFTLPAGEHYLNCAYMGPLSRRTQEAGIQGIRRKAAPASIRAQDFFSDSDRLRALFARLIGAPEPDRVAIMPAASYGVAVAARNVKARAGQSVVIAGEQFPSNVYAWSELCARGGLELRAVPAPDSESRGETWNAALLDAIDSSTAVVALPQVHWTDGTRFDLQAIGARAREHGASLVIDATQSVGAMPFDVGVVRPDALIVAGYKWLLGPYSLALGWFGPRFDDGEPLEYNWIARRGSEDFRRLVHYRDEYQPGATRYDAGERSNFILVPMLIAALEEILEWRPERIQAYCAALTADLIQDARQMGFRIERDEWRGAHLFGLRVPRGLDLAALQAALENARISASLRGNALRLAPNVYNDDGDIAALTTVLHSVSSAQ